ncbi:MAG: NADH-quinone oxidoreductase subunit N [Thermoplasmatales archaeon]|nr:NADH-quinone oxidoreductase subunit N [Thermoplasmatales archaeon]
MDMSFLKDVFGEFVPILPQIVMVLATLTVPALFYANRSGKACAWFSLGALALVGILVGLMMHDGTFYGDYAGLFSFDPFSGLMMLLFLAVAFLTVLVSPDSTEVTIHKGEYYAIIMGIVTGMFFVASASNLMVLFVGVEVVSISSYALVALKKNDPRAAEAAVKYFIVGGLSSALTLYGISLFYGMTHTLDIAGVAAAVDTMEFTGAFALATIALIAGYGFKIAAVPFHMWAPDVYEGAATPVSGFLATGSKKMGFVLFFKVFLMMFVVLRSGFATQEVQYLFAVIAAVTMTLGNIVAISQSNIKRMLAYSSIAQAGYILIALAVMSEYALVGGMFHMFTHVFMKFGAFIVVLSLIAAGLGERIQDYNGLAKRAPFVAFAMLLFLFSLAGIPPLAGFTSKFVLFSSAIYVNGAVVTQWVWLAIVAIVNSAISLYYYARVVKAMYVEEGPTDALAIRGGHKFAIALCVVAVILLGVFPTPLLEAIGDAAAHFFLAP